MEKIENYAVSEEALEEVVGGLNKKLIKKVAIGTGVTFLAICGVVGAGSLVHHCLGKKRVKKDVPVGNSETSDENRSAEFDREWSDYMLERMNQED